MTTPPHDATRAACERLEAMARALHPGHAFMVYMDKNEAPGWFCLSSLNITRFADRFGREWFKLGTTEYVASTHLEALLTERAARRSEVENSADLPLIEAAPDLLAACKQALECMPQEAFSDTTPAQREANGVLRAAIARAEGRAP